MVIFKALAVIGIIWIGIAFPVIGAVLLLMVLLAVLVG